MFIAALTIFLADPYGNLRTSLFAGEAPFDSSDPDIYGISARKLASSYVRQACKFRARLKSIYGDFARFCNK
jgi:hypothetical protein